MSASQNTHLTICVHSNATQRLRSLVLANIPFSLPNPNSSPRPVSLHFQNGMYCNSPASSIMCSPVSIVRFRHSTEMRSPSAQPRSEPRDSSESTFSPAIAWAVGMCRENTSVVRRIERREGRAKVVGVDRRAGREGAMGCECGHRPQGKGVRTGWKVSRPQQGTRERGTLDHGGRDTREG